MNSPHSALRHRQLSIRTDDKHNLPISMDDLKQLKARRGRSKMDMTLPAKLNISEDSMYFSQCENDENLSINESRKKNPVAHILRSYRIKIKENEQLKRDNFLAQQQSVILKDQIRVLNQRISELQESNSKQSKCKLDTSSDAKSLNQLSSELDFDEVAEAFLLGLDMKEDNADYLKVQGLVKRARETIHDLKLEMEEWKMVYNKFQSENTTLRKALTELNSAKKMNNYSSTRRSACLTKI